MNKEIITKKIIFRADGNYRSGLGHLFRLFSLVEMLKDNYQYIFLTRNDTFLDVIPKSYPKKIIPSNISVSDEPAWISSAFNCNDFIIIADGYHFNSKYQKELKSNSFKLIYIDDFTSEKIFADIVINHAINVKPEDFNVIKKTKLALGSNYALLRPKFIEVSRKSKKIKKISEVFICFGGSDFYNLSQVVLDSIIDIQEIKKIHIVLGGANKNKNFGINILDNNKVCVYRNISEIELIKIMEKCQLAIVPSSTISYEACSVKMVILSGYYVDNQKKINEGLISNNLIYDAGNFKKLNSNYFRKKVIDVINDNPENYFIKIKNQSKMFDGKQKKRFNKLISNIC